jgi:hypothetical protein
VPEQDKDSAELVRYMAEEVTPEVSRFMGTVAGSPSLEVGELIAEQIRAWRFQREIKHVKKAMKQLDDAGMSPSAVPLRTLAPLIEGGSLESDDSMSDRWASLLANAASGERDVPPSFPGVLRELEPVQAQLLDQTYDLSMQIAPDLRHTHGLDRRSLLRGMGLTVEEYAYHVDNLIRLRLVRSLSTLQGDDSRVVALTEFGRAFVRACRPPAQPDPPIQYSDREELAAIVRRNQERWASEEAASRADPTPTGEES